MVRKASPTSNAATYWIELNTTPISMYFSFYCSAPSAIKNDPSSQDVQEAVFEGVICSSSTTKIKQGTPITITLGEGKEGEPTFAGFSKRKDRGALYIYLKKGYFFPLCDYIKNGSLKYIRLGGDELFRGSAWIYDVDFSSTL